MEVSRLISGPLSRAWLLVLGKGIRTSAQTDLESLARRGGVDPLPGVTQNPRSPGHRT